jgi:hypothetical protein
MSGTIKIDIRQTKYAASATMLGGGSNITTDVLISNADAQLQKIFASSNEFLCDGGLISFTGTIGGSSTISFSEPLLLIFPQVTGSTASVPQIINLGSATQTLNNGDMLIATVNKSSIPYTAALSILSTGTSGTTVAPPSLTNQDIFVIAYRQDSADGVTPTIYLRNGSGIASGQSLRLGSGGGGGGGLTNPMTGNLNMNSYLINNLGTPLVATDAANMGSIISSGNIRQNILTYAQLLSTGIAAATIIYFTQNPVNNYNININGTTYTFITGSQVHHSVHIDTVTGVSQTMQNLVLANNQSGLYGNPNNVAVYTTAFNGIYGSNGVIIIYDKTISSGQSSSTLSTSNMPSGYCQYVNFRGTTQYSTSIISTSLTLSSGYVTPFGFRALSSTLLNGEIHLTLDTKLSYIWNQTSWLSTQPPVATDIDNDSATVLGIVSADNTQGIGISSGLIYAKIGNGLGFDGSGNIEVTQSASNLTTSAFAAGVLDTSTLTNSTSNIPTSAVVISAIANCIPSWNSTISYTVGNLVISNNNFFICIQGNSNIQPPNYNYWQNLNNIQTWIGNKLYANGDLVIHNNNIYQATQNNSTSTWNQGFWQNLSTIQTWTANNGYRQNELVIYNNGIYQANTDTNSPTFNYGYFNNLGTQALTDTTLGNTTPSTISPPTQSAVQTYIKNILLSPIAAWNSANSYVAGNVVTYSKDGISNNIYQSIDSNNNSPKSNSHWNNLSNIQNWDSASGYNVGDLVIYSNDSVVKTLYQCNTSTNSNISTSGSSWNKLCNTPLWIANTTYAIGDTVINGNNAYRCINPTNESSFNPGNWLKLGGTVTSVGLSLPSIFNVTVSPITTSGTLTATLNTQTMNTFLAGPTSGSAQTPTFRAIVAADIPPLNNYSLAALNDSTLGGGSPSTTVPPTQAAVQSYVTNEIATNNSGGGILNTQYDLSTGGNLTLSGPGIGNIYNAVVIPYKVLSKSGSTIWRLRFNFYMSVNGTYTGSITLSIVGVVFKYGSANNALQSVCVNTGLSTGFSIGTTQPNTNQIVIQSQNTINAIDISGDVELQSAPTTTTWN